nr:MAG TPA: hypothetical protein [Caudoviricetes sp.]
MDKQYLDIILNNDGSVLSSDDVTVPQYSTNTYIRVGFKNIDPDVYVYISFEGGVKKVLTPELDDKIPGIVGTTYLYQLTQFETCDDVNKKDFTIQIQKDEVIWQTIPLYFRIKYATFGMFTKSDLGDDSSIESIAKTAIDAAKDASKIDVNLKANYYTKTESNDKFSKVIANPEIEEINRLLTVGIDGVNYLVSGIPGETGKDGIGLDSLTDVNLTLGDTTVQYDTNDGIQLTSTGRFTYTNTDKSEYTDATIDLDIPIKAGNGISIDKAATGEFIEIKNTLSLPTITHAGSILYAPSVGGEWVESYRSNGNYLQYNPRDVIINGSPVLAIKAPATEINLGENFIDPLKDTRRLQYMGFGLESNGRFGLYSTTGLSGIQGFYYMSPVTGYQPTIYSLPDATGETSVKQHYILTDRNVKTINGQSIYSADGTGDITISAGTVDADSIIAATSAGKNISISKVDDKAQIAVNASPTFDSITLNNELVLGEEYTGYTSVIESPSHTRDITFRFSYDTTEDIKFSQLLKSTNVKTLFGNQSIVGTGNIDLYKHNITVSVARRC